MPGAIDQNADNALLASIADQQLGAAPAPAGAPAAVVPPPAPSAPPKAPTGDTNADKVQTAVSPNTEASASAQEPVSYKVIINGEERTLTPEQIAQTTSRYADLNYKHQTEVAPIKPAIDILNKIVAQAKADGIEVSGEDLAALLTRSLMSQANSHETQFGSGSQNDKEALAAAGVERTNTLIEKSQPAGSMDAQLAQWEAENAVTLPPGFKDMAKKMNGLESQNTEMASMMKQLIGHMQGVATTAEGQLKKGSDNQSAAYRQTIANNLNKAQAKFNLPDETSQEFLMFAGERGYGIEDFIDPSLTEKAVQDFAAVRNTPEMERLKAINTKRQAFTGITTAGGASNQTQPTAPNADASFINAMSEQALRAQNKL